MRTAFELTDDQKKAIREAILQEWGTCYNCMPWEGGPVWMVPHEDLGWVVRTWLEDFGVSGFDLVEDVDEIVGQLDLKCPWCRTPWTEAGIEIGEYPEGTEPLDLAFLREATEVRAERVEALVLFADIAGFSEWMRRPTTAPETVEAFMKEVYRFFDRFRAHFGFRKLLGDGFMGVFELDGNVSPGITVSSILHGVLSSVTDFPKIAEAHKYECPDQIRARIAVGYVWRIVVADRTGYEQRDYIGYQVNLASRLLRVRPDIPVVVHGNLKRRFEIPNIDWERVTPDEDWLKGVDQRDLGELYTPVGTPFVLSLF